LQIWRVLAALREKGRRRMGDLSKTTSIEVSTLTRLVDSMEKAGWWRAVATPRTRAPWRSMSRRPGGG
jgi:DNA-binding MarR family transcriptional regulator